MLVHFIVSRDGLREDPENIKSIIDVIKAKGHTLVNSWVEDASKNVASNEPLDDEAWQKIVTSDSESIARADVIIAEISYDSTALGYQIATAVQQKKPTLLILQESSKVPAFTWNIPSSFLDKVEYNRDNVGEKINPFLAANDIGTKDMRFNFFIDRHIYNYLRWKALRTGKTKAEVLRNLIEREIDVND